MTNTERIYYIRGVISSGSRDLRALDLLGELAENIELLEIDSEILHAVPYTEEPHEQ